MRAWISLVCRRASRFRTRSIYIALALGTIALGLLVHLGGAALGPVVRDALGDALWAAMMAWWVGAVAPAAPLIRRSLIAYAICAGVELSQLYQTPAIDAIRTTTLGQLVLGSGFDVRDLAAYAIGVAGAVVLEATARARLAYIT